MGNSCLCLSLTLNLKVNGRKMKSLIILATLAFANGATVYPAGVDPNACPNYPFCGATAPADFPTPVVNGQPIAPILNTTPEQTAFWQKAQLVTAPAGMPQPVINNEPVAPTLNTVPAQTRAHEQHLLISMQQQLQQLEAAQQIQIMQQQQEIAARHFGRL